MVLYSLYCADVLLRNSSLTDLAPQILNTPSSHLKNININLEQFVLDITIRPFVHARGGILRTFI